jgi:hypothetical protein
MLQDAQTAGMRKLHRSVIGVGQWPVWVYLTVNQVLLAADPALCPKSALSPNYPRR